jgi:quercetin dioxygenase-like cupin family protein
MNWGCLTGILALALYSAAQTVPVPVDQEPHHRVVLKNDSLLVMRVTLPAGETTLYHTHSNDRAAVHLTANTLTFQLPGQAESPTQESEIGEISASARGDKPYTHRVHNIGPGTFEVIDVEFLQRPKDASSKPAAAVAAENPSARVYNWKLAPGASSAQHTHTRPHLIIAVRAMPLKMTAPDGRSLSEEVKPGDFHWIDANVTHTLTNEGGFDGQIVEIELK